MLIKPDPYIPFYELEKMQNPEKKLWWMAVRRGDAEGIDRLVELSHGRDEVKTESDWKAMEELLKFYVQRWPAELSEFRKVIPQIREAKREKGYSESKEIMHIASLPPRLERLIKTVFPHQQFNKNFVYKLVKRYKMFKVGGL